MYYLKENTIYPTYFTNFTLEEWNTLPLEEITFLDFVGNQLSELPNLDRCINLITLHCCNNSLIKLPNLDNLIYLEEILCQYNNLIELPNLDKLINLKELICYNNNLIELPVLNKLINLKELDCSSNLLTEIPISIRKCKKLKFYKLKYDIPDYEYIEDLPELVNYKIEKYYYKPGLDYYNSKFL